MNMADIERIAMVLSKSSKTVADWKLKFPILQDTMKVKLASEMEKVNKYDIHSSIMLFPVTMGSPHIPAHIF